MSIAAAALGLFSAACAGLPPLREATCLPKVKVLRTEHKVDGAVVGVICNERVLKGIL